MTLSRIFTVREFTGRHMLITMVMFFGVILTANLTMAWFASNSWSGLVAKNGYVESLNYKSKQAEVERQQLLGWKSKLSLKNDQVVFSVKDADGRAVTGLAITARLGRPATEKSDVTIRFKEAKPGEYLSKAPGQDGQWLVDIRATGKDQQSYQKKYRFLVGASR